MRRPTKGVARELVEQDQQSEGSVDTDPAAARRCREGFDRTLVRQLRESSRDVVFYDPTGVLCPGAGRIFADAELL